MIALPYIYDLKLHLEDSQISNEDFVRVLKEAEEKLLTINLSKSVFSVEGLGEQMINLEHLKELTLSSTQITGVGLSGLCAPQLEVLNLSCNRLTNSRLLDILSNCSSKLKVLDLSFNMITGVGLSGLCAPQLEVLNLSDCDTLTDSGLLDILSNCSSKLKELNLSFTMITGVGLSGLCVPQLEVLNLPAWFNHTDSVLVDLRSKCSSNLRVTLQH